jgi:hypothetical protein
MTVYSVALRRILEEERTLSVDEVVEWDLIDRWGKPVANGLYYLRLEVETASGKVERLWKVIVAR